MNPEWDTFETAFVCDSKTTDITISLQGETQQKQSRSFTLPPSRDTSESSIFLESFDISPRAAGLKRHASSSS